MTPRLAGPQVEDTVGTHTSEFKQTVDAGHRMMEQQIEEPATRAAAAESRSQQQSGN